MRFFLQKFITAFIEPPGLFITIALIFGYKTWRKQKNPTSWFTLVIIIYLLSTGVGLRLFPIPDVPPPSNLTISPQLIIVLGGGTITDSDRNRTFVGPYTLLRLHQGFVLWQKKQLPILVSGGNIWKKAGQTEAESMADILLGWGVPPKYIIQENKSRDTWENARYCSDILKNNQLSSFYLVTSEIHLKRAEMSFRAFLPDASIIPVSAHPPYDRTSLTFLDFLPSFQAFSAIAQILHEYFGLVSYFIL